VSKRAQDGIDELLSTKDASKIAGVNARTIRRWFEAGLIDGETIPFGTRTLLRFSRMSLVAHLASRNKKADQSVD
jgi:hypothetical protein